MQYFKFLSPLIILLIFGCQQTANEKSPQNEELLNSHSETGSQNELPAESQINSPAAASTTIVAHKMLDNKNELMGIIPLPSDWIINNKPGKTFLMGPNGINVYNIPMKTFVHSADPMYQQSYAQAGVKMRQYMDIENLIRQDLVPIAQKEGSKLVRITRAPAIAASDKSFSDMLFKVAPSDNRYEAAISEWIDKKGDPYLIVVHQNAMFMDNFVSWSYYSHAMEAPANVYESAKKILVAGLAGIQYNPRYVDAYNQSESQKASASWAAHNNRMRENQRNFDNWQRNHASTTAAINEASMAAYRSRDASSDRNHNRFLNYIKDENTVTQSGTGQKYQVEAGANEYWMDANGNYVKSNDPNYDPNRDPNNDGRQWQQTEIQR